MPSSNLTRTVIRFENRSLRAANQIEISIYLIILGAVVDNESYLGWQYGTKTL
jgi:hypothetical protein